MIASRCAIKWSAALMPLPPRMALMRLSGREDRYVELRTMQNKFKYALRMCGIEDANFHSLRHTFATRCIETGVDVKCLSEILGHASVNITLNRYVHPSMELKAKNLNRLSGLFALK